MIGLRKFFFIPVVTISIFLVVLTGCGEKGPPLPPVVQGNTIAPAHDLKASLHEGMVTLTWKHQVDPETARIDPEAFELYMAKKGPDDCETCPFEFNSIALVKMPRNWHLLHVEKGYKYYFRMKAIGENNVRSDYSETVQVEN